MAATLAASAARGGAITVVGQLMKFFIQVLGLILLARLLSPRDYGLLAMVTVIINLGDVIRDFGLSAAAVQAKDLSHPQKSNLFWINSAIGAVLSTIVFLCATPISNLYGEPSLVAITQTLSVIFLIKGVQTQFQAELSRSMKFFALAWTDILAMALGFAVAIGAATQGFTYWALVAQLAVPPVVLLVSRGAVARWLPGLPNRRDPMRSLLVYGGNLMLTQSLIYLSANIDSFVVGSRFGATSLGYYNRAFQLLSLPLSQMLSPLTGVALPVLSRIQEERLQFARYVENAQKVIGYSVGLIFSIGIAGAAPLIDLALGEKWGPSAHLFQILAIGGIFQAVGYVSYWIFLARGLTKSHLRYSVISRSVMILCILVGSAWGVTGVAAGYAVGVALGWPAALWWLNRITIIPATELLRSGTRIISVSFTSILLGLLLRAGLDGWSELAQLTASTILVVGTFALAAVLFDTVRADVRIVFNFGRSALAKKSR